MKTNTITKFRWFWAWQDEAEETWLEEMSRSGYHLNSVGIPGIYSFIVAEPRNYVYRLDYQTFRRKDRQEYLQLFGDAGWEHVGNVSAWQYFRKEVVPGESPEIYTDVESKAAKYRRVLAYLGFTYVLMLVILAGRILSDDPYPWWDAVRIIYAMILVFLTYALIRTAIRVRHLKKL